MTQAQTENLSPTDLCNSATFFGREQRGTGRTNFDVYCAAQTHIAMLFTKSELLDAQRGGSIWRSTPYSSLR